MSNFAKTSASIDWKQRYAELVDQQDKQQQRYKRKQDLLVVALAQLTTYCRDLDSHADEKLRALRAVLRQENFKNVDLAQVVEAVNSQLETSKERRVKQQKDTSNQLGRLVKQVSSFTDSSEIQKQFVDLKKTIEVQPIEFGTLAAHLTSLHQLAIIAVKSRKSGQSILQRWLGPWSPAQAVEPEPGLSLEAIEGYLSRLLSEVEHGAEMQGTFEVALRVLREGLSLDNIEVAIQSVAEVVLAAVASDRNDMRSYLSEMNARLQSATASLGASENLFKEEVSRQQNFTQSMTSSVQGIREQLHVSGDLQQLKQDLNRSLDQMESVVSNNQQEGQAIQSQLSDQLETLVLRAKELEQQGAAAERKAAEQRRRALTDSLTGLPNREAYEETAAREVQRWQRYGRPLCLAVCDIDLFKSVNDSYGHAAGDEVLRQIADLLKQRLRGSDFLARYGGEEFVVLLPETDSEQTELVMQSVRELVQQTRIDVGGKLLDVTISIGVAEFRGKDILQSAFTRADRALYQAKLNGRNRVEMALD